MSADLQLPSFEPEDQDAHRLESAITDYAAELIDADEVDELVAEIYGAADEILAAMCSGRSAPSREAIDFMQRVRRIQKNLDCARELA